MYCVIIIIITYILCTMQVLHEYSRSPLHVYPRAIYAPARARLEEVRAAILKEKQRQQRQQRKQQTTNNNDKDIDDNLPLGFVDLQQHERSVLLTDLSTRRDSEQQGRPVCWRFVLGRRVCRGGGRRAKCYPFFTSPSSPGGCFAMIMIMVIQYL